jgi:hypothetical protein
MHRSAGFVFLPRLLPKQIHAAAIPVIAALACLPLFPVRGTAAPPDAGSVFSFYHLRTVMPQSRSAPGRPLELVSYRLSRSGSHLITFREKRTGKTFRDSGALSAEFTRLAQDGK